MFRQVDANRWADGVTDDESAPTLTRERHDRASNGSAEPIDARLDLAAAIALRQIREPAKTQLQ